VERVRIASRSGRRSLESDYPFTRQNSTLKVDAIPTARINQHGADLKIATGLANMPPGCA
jgi:hypothetical protein